MMLNLIFALGAVEALLGLPVLIVFVVQMMR
jgi:hypothetical protein